VWCVGKWYRNAHSSLSAVHPCIHHMDTARADGKRDRSSDRFAVSDLRPWSGQVPSYPIKIGEGSIQLPRQRSFATTIAATRKQRRRRWRWIFVTGIQRIYELKRALIRTTKFPPTSNYLIDGVPGCLLPTTPCIIVNIVISPPVFSGSDQPLLWSDLEEVSPITLYFRILINKIYQNLFIQFI
jgi:hypothetical protein